MRKIKPLNELTISNNFMFGAVMSDEEICREFLEMTLGFPIEKVTVSKEKSIIYHPEYKGIRLDIIAKDKKHTHYNVEMQVSRKPALGKRGRYYHSQIDMELLLSGADYAILPDTYVIFVCDFDPFNKGKYRYTFCNTCKEDDTVSLEDGSCTIFLSTCGKNAGEVPESLVKFLKYAGAKPAESTADFEDGFVRKLQASVRSVKESREMEARYMLLEELLKDERAEGKAEGKAEAVLTLLEELGEIPEPLREEILEEKRPDVLQSYLKKVFVSKSVGEFMENMHK